MGNQFSQGGSSKSSASRMKLDNTTIRTMSFFSKRTGVSPVNCITSNKTLVFVVEKGQAIKALGKNGENVKSMRSAFNKDIKVFERGENIDETVQNFLYPIKLNSIRVLRRVLSILLDNPEERRILLANGRKQLKILRTVLSQYHPEIRDVQVL